MVGENDHFARRCINTHLQQHANLVAEWLSSSIIRQENRADMGSAESNSGRHAEVFQRPHPSEGCEQNGQP
jgi:hypothetical protein